MKDCRWGLSWDGFHHERLNNDNGMIVYMSGYGDEYALGCSSSIPFIFKKPFRLKNFRKPTAFSCKACEEYREIRVSSSFKYPTGPCIGFPLKEHPLF